METKYLDIIPEDISYLIFIYIDGYDILYNLTNYTPFNKIINSKYSYIRKIQDTNSDMIINPIILEKFMDDALTAIYEFQISC